MSNRFTKQILYDTNENGCHICTSHCKDKDGYPQITDNGKQQHLSRHLYELEYEKIPAGKVVRHTCDNTSCVNLDHFILGTQNDNINDKMKRNRQAQGETCGKSKLKEVQVIEIRKDNRPNSTIAKDYNVASSTVDRIKNNKTWRGIL